MAKRQRNRVKTKKGMWIVVLVALVICASMILGQQHLAKTSRALATQQQSLEDKIEVAKEKSESLDEQKVYMQTDEYVEDTAREKLGMVKKGEILFKAEGK